MANVQNDITVLKGNLRYKGATERIISIPTEFVGDQKELIESDRTRNVNALTQSEIERQKSNIFRIGGKITNLFANVLVGSTNYEGYKNYLYLTNELQVVQDNPILFNSFSERVPDTFGLKWNGFPQYNEFSFIRTDYDNPHIDFEPQSASTYNWTVQLSYPYSSDTQQKMIYVDKQLDGNTLSFKASDGIPFTILNNVINGSKYITFRCGGNHNLQVSQYAELSLSYNGRNSFKVDLLGEPGFKNEKTSFSIADIGYTGTTFADGTVGTFKRNIYSSSGDSRSKYYVRLHKILTDELDSDVNNMGFENNPFGVEQKLEYSALTPNLQQRVSIKDGTQNYSFTFKRDFDVTEIYDNNFKPLTNVYVTILNKGYYGWFNKPQLNTLTALQYGWDFNFHSEFIDDWWKISNTDSFEKITTSSYTKVSNGQTYQFFYNNTPKKGDVVVGDFCEFNESEQMEYVISKCQHKITFNESVYQTSDNGSDNPAGYFYQPHHPILLRAFSTSLSDVVGQSSDEKKPWAFYSSDLNRWLWRDLIPYGDFEDGVGVDYPFLNDAHYPFKDILFMISTPYKNINANFPVLEQPTIDNCE